jgi:hypothetical protein
VKQQIIFAVLLIGLTAWVVPVAGQKGGRGGSADPESTPMGIQHTAPTAGSDYEGFLYGVVKEVNKDGMVLTKTQAGSDQAFKFGKKTKFVHDGKGSTVTSLKLGDQVWVDADENKKTGDLVARKVVSGVFTMPSE